MPSRLIGRRLELRLYHDRIVGYIGKQQVVELPRLRVSSQDKRRARCIMTSLPMTNSLAPNDLSNRSNQQATAPQTSPPNPSNSPYQSLSGHLKKLRLSHMLSHWEDLQHQAMQEQWSYAQFLLALCELEVERRWQY